MTKYFLTEADVILFNRNNIDELKAAYNELRGQVIQLAMQKELLQCRVDKLEQDLAVKTVEIISRTQELKDLEALVKAAVKSTPEDSAQRVCSLKRVLDEKMK